MELFERIEAIKAIFEDTEASVSWAGAYIRDLYVLDPASGDDIRHYYDMTARQAGREARQFGSLPARGLIRTRAKRARAMKRLAIDVMAWQDRRTASRV